VPVSVTDVASAATLKSISNIFIGHCALGHTPLWINSAQFGREKLKGGAIPERISRSRQDERRMHEA
jgi:hypothetical protein